MGLSAPIVEHWSYAIYVLAVVGIAAAMLLLSFVLGGRTRGGARDEPFESGVVSVGTGRLRFPAKFYLVAMFFVVFDLESVFIYAWAVSLRSSGWAGLIEVTIFVFILLAGLYYLWRVGGLDWGPASRRRSLNVLPVDGRLP